MAPEPPRDRRRYHVPNLARALQVLESLAAQPHQGISQLASGLGIPRNSVFRIVATLADHGYLIHEPASQSYHLSRKLLALGHRVVEHEGLLSRSLDVLADLREATRETALIAVLLDEGGVVLEQCISPRAVKVSVQVGHRFPLHTAAPAKAMLAWLPEPLRDRLLADCDFRPFTPATRTTRQALLADLAGARATGYACDVGEELAEVHCVAAPVLDHRQHPVASIWVTAPAARLPPAAFPEVGEHVAGHAARITQRLGGVAPMQPSGDP